MGTKQQEINLTHLTAEALEQMLNETQEQYKKMKESQEDDTSSGWQLTDNLYYFQNLIEEIEVEKVRREENMSLKEIPELEELANEAYRKVRHMENYDWDVVEDSSEENKRGFFQHIDYLERLQSAANKEIEWKMRRLRT